MPIHILQLGIKNYVDISNRFTTGNVDILFLKPERITLLPAFSVLQYFTTVTLFPFRIKLKTNYANTVPRHV